VEKVKSVSKRAADVGQSRLSVQVQQQLQQRRQEKLLIGVSDCCIGRATYTYVHIGLLMITISDYHCIAARVGVLNARVRS